MSLSAENVQRIFNDCLFKEEEDTHNSIIAQGITHNFGFHPDRLEKHKDEIKELLLYLPEHFQKNYGGWSFLNGCLDKYGKQWGEQRDVQNLLVLGLATKQAYYCFPKEMWAILPGGVPYFGIIVE